MFVNGNTLSRSGNPSDDRNNSSELNIKPKKNNTNQTETIVSSKKNYNITNRTPLTKSELCHNNMKGPLGNKRDAQPKLQNSEDIRKVISDLDLDVDRIDVNRIDVDTYQLIKHHLSTESQRTIAELLEKVDRLTTLEKLILYLRLPTGKDLLDPLKLPINPLGSRFEINQTVNWIRSHLQENSAISLPKQEVYEEYKVYCVKNTMKPLSTADFGKVMKQVFPDVRPRRLGTRGNSRYCYAGLCKMAHLSVPELPSLQDKMETRNGNSSCAMKGVVCSWLEKVMGRKFKSFEEIGKHFLSLERTDLSAPCEHKSATIPPNCLRAKSTERNSPVKKIQENILKSKQNTQETICLSLESTQVKKKPHIPVGKGKRKAPNVLIKKRPLSNSLNENTTGKKLKTSAHQSESNESICDINNRKSLTEDFLQNGKHISIKFSKDLIPDISTKQPYIQRIKRYLGSDILLNNVSNDMKDNTNVISENKLGEKIVISPVQEINSTKDTHILQIGSKIPIPRITKKCSNKPATANLMMLPAVVASSSSPIRQYKPIKPSPLKEKLNTTTEISNDFLGKNCIIQKQGSLQGEKNDNQVSIGFLDNDVLDDYLHGDGNSQEQEEELLKYFQPQNPLVATPVEKKVHSETLSQLRSLLEKNMNTGDKLQSLNLKIMDDFPSVTSTVPDNLCAGTSTNIQENLTLQDVGASTGSTKQQDQRAIVFPSLIIAGPNLNSRRRVSFENLPDSVPQSPNTRRKVFNFTPISPTKTKSVCESPFVSPRDTQVPRLKQQTSVPPSSLKNKKSLLNHVPVLKSPSPSANIQLRPIFNSDSVKRSEAITKSSVLPVQHKIFLLPCSPVSVGEPQMFNIKENVQSPKPLECKTEEKIPNSSQIPSLLQSILTYGKYKPKTETQEHEDTKNSNTSVMSNFNVSDPLSQEVSKFFPEGGIPASIMQPQLGYRSHSVPVVSSSALISPLSTTQPFPMFYSTPNEFDSSVEATPVPSDITDFGSVINAESSSSNFLLMTDENGVQNFEDYEVPEQNDLLIHSAMNKIFEMITDGSKAPILEIDENEKCQQPSRSYPNTPVPYNTSFENNSRDPIVSAFAPKPPIPNQQGSRSYPSTPVFSSQLLNNPESLLNSTSTARRNINLLLPDSSSSLGLLTKEEEETLSLQLPGCEDTFNVLAAVVADDVGGDSDL